MTDVVNRIVLDDGGIPTSVASAHIDGSADGLERRLAVQVFDGHRTTLQTLRVCQQLVGAAFIAHVDAAEPAARR